MASTVLPNGIIIPEKFSRDWYADLYHNWQELDNLLGGGTPKNGTLTIQKNGTAVGTFSANQATDETINIEVPTKTSDLNNDSGFITGVTWNDVADKPSFATVATSGSYNDLSNKPTIPTVNDATLTIQKNGTTVDTFTANSSTDKTVDITVPTKTSDLTNDSNFVESSDLATVATSGNYNDLSNKPTIPTVNNATLTIQKNGTNVQTFTANQSTNATANITVPTKTSDLTNDSGFITSDNTKIPLAGSNQISGDLIPSTDGTVNLGGPSYQWNNAYIKSLTINGVACGDILTHNASEFVNVTGAQTIGGVKTFSDGDKTFNDSAPLRIQGCKYDNEFSSNARTVLELRSNRDTVDKSCIYISKFRQNRPQGSMGDGSAILTIDVLENEVRTNDLLKFTARNWINDVPTVMSLEPPTKASNIQSFLGSSSRPWGDTITNAINGINPGALSLPSSTYINVDTTNWDLTCQNGLMGSFTPTADGWLMLHVANSGTSEANFWVIGGVIRINNKSTLNTSDNNNFNMITIPVEKDVTYNIYGNASEYVAGRSVEYCRFMPCRGNI